MFKVALPRILLHGLTFVPRLALAALAKAFYALPYFVLVLLLVTGNLHSYSYFIGCWTL